MEFNIFWCVCIWLRYVENADELLNQIKSAVEIKNIAVILNTLGSFSGDISTLIEISLQGWKVVIFDSFYFDVSLQSTEYMREICWFAFNLFANFSKILQCASISKAANSDENFT